jgi:hypothetical protein
MAQKTLNRDVTWTEFLSAELWASPELPSAKFDKCAPHLNKKTHLGQATRSCPLYSTTKGEKQRS